MQKNFILCVSFFSVCLILTLSSVELSAQTVTASPQNVIRPVGPNSVSLFLNRLPGGWDGDGTYVWSVSPSNGVVIGPYSQSSPAADVTVSFSSAASGAYTFQLTRGNSFASVTVNVGNIATCSSNGDAVSAFNVLNGSYISGPGNIFSPVVQTAALGISTSGYFYYMPRNFFGNDGNVTVYAAKPDGSSSTPIASIDLNGNNDLGFVRMAVDPIGNGWLLAGDNSTLYLAKFVTNGINPTTIHVVDPSVSLVNGNVSSFYNGDICFSGNGTLYAMANVTNGITQIFTGTLNGTSTTLTKKWDLVNQNGNNFSGSVNGVAFDALGSLYISTSAGLYYINQNTVNTATGTVQCSLVRTVSGLTDLGSNLFPQQSALPVRLTSFSGSYQNQKTTLNWETEAEVNFDHFEIERSSNGSDYVPIGSKPATGSAGKQVYQFVDDLSAISGRVFTYRLKMVDIDGRFKYSTIILIRKETNNIKSITITPNPVSNRMAAVRFYAASAGSFDLRVVDISGKTVLQQKVKVSEGNNSVSANGIDRLSAGIYTIQMTNGSGLQSAKFIISQ
jgi:Secretion system C-terminal sorting domain